MSNTKKLTYTAIFAAIATILMYFEFPLPLMPPFLKVDLSGAVILIGAFIFGIAPAIAMIAIKDLFHLLQTQTAGSGELADFLILSTLVIVSVTFYHRHKTRNMALIGCLSGTVCMSIVGMLTNYYIILPFYTNGMGWDLQTIFDLCASVNAKITGMSGYLLLGVLPFNLIKGVILTIITMLVYKKLSLFIKSRQAEHRMDK